MIRMTPNKKLDIHYNYLSDAIDSTGVYKYKSTDYHFCEDEKDCNIKININGKCYKDPDGVSNKLYLDLSLLTNLDYVDGKSKDYVGDYKYKHLLYNDLPFTSDYFGVSKYWAQHKALYTEFEVGDFLNVFRTIGGHMIWHSIPKNIGYKKYTINWARGGRDGVYDRVDLTLYGVQCYYLKKDFKFSNTLFEAIKNESNWFDEYGKGEEGFKVFIDSFLLNDFVDNNYDVLSLVYDKPIEESEKKTSIFDSRDTFDAYVDNSKNKIINRTNKMCAIGNE